MIELMEQDEVFLSHFRRFEQDSADSGPSWLMPTRKAALARFADLGFPTRHHEQWRYTSVDAIAHTAFEPAHLVAANVRRADLDALMFDGESHRLVFVNGRFADEFSNVGSLPAGVRVQSLVSAMAESPALLERHLARHAHFQDRAFVALNTALFDDGAFIHVKPGVVLERPIHLIFVVEGSGQSVSAHVRNLIVLDTNAQVSVVETYAGLGESSTFSNTVTEVVTGENANLDHYKVVQGEVSGLHMSAFQADLQRSSHVRSCVMNFGGGLVRNELGVRLAGEGAQCTLNGLTVVDGDRHVDNHLIVDHVEPHCDSWEYFKTILDDRSRSVFSGRINVHKGAQKTDAKQTNMSLLLSPDAQIESKPQLEILADDVRCTHGATVGQIDTDALFYLRSRGLSQTAARSLLVYAFAHESIQEIRVDPLRQQMQSLLIDRLPQGHLLRDRV